MATQLHELNVDLITRWHLEKGLETLRSEFQGIFSAETVERFMTESLEALSGARVKDYVPLFVHRFARERLRALGQVEGTIAKEVPEVLFVCVQNAGRSQMAAALLDHYGEGRVHVRSAGSAPADQLNSNVVAAMTELGIDLSKEFPKPMTDEVVKAADAVITMGCGDACPIYPGKRYEDWEVDDPAEADLAGVRRIRDDIDERVRRLLSDVTATADVQACRRGVGGRRPQRHRLGDMDAKQWLATYADNLGVAPPTADELEAVLDLAAEAAHASERFAAPVACWLSAKAGRSLEESLALARDVTAQA
jgi:arsenate reductase